MSSWATRTCRGGYCACRWSTDPAIGSTASSRSCDACSTVARRSCSKPAGRDCAARAYVENVAAAIALATTDERATGRIYNVGEADPLTEAEWAAAIGDAAGWRGRIVAISAAQLPSHLQMKADPDHEFYLSSARIRRELGYAEPIPRDEALRRTVAWERDHPPAAIDPAKFDYATEERALAALGA